MQQIPGAGGGSVSGPITSSGLTMATARLLGRTTASTGAIEEIQVGSGLSLSAGTLSATGGTLDYIQFNASVATPTHVEGKVYWDANDHTLALMSEFPGSVLQVGREMWVRVVNKTGVQINDGQVVYINGAQGNRPTVALASASTTTADSTIGIATNNIADNAEGYITVFGEVHGYNTTGFTAGATLYVSATAGDLTSTRPAAPGHAILVGYAENSTVNGTILVSVDPGNHLGGLHDVFLTGVADKHTLQYNNANSRWENVAGGITGSGANTQLAFWNGASTLTGSALLTWTGTALSLNRTQNDATSRGHMFITRGDGSGSAATWNSTGDGSNGVATFGLTIGGAERFSISATAGVIISGSDLGYVTSGQVAIGGGYGRFSSYLFSDLGIFVKNPSGPGVDGANFERFIAYYSGNTLLLGHQQAGTGVARPVSLRGSYFTIDGTDPGSVSAGQVAFGGGLGRFAGSIIIGGVASINGGYTSSSGDLGVSRTNTAGAIYFGRSSSRYISFDGSTCYIGNDPVNIPNATASTSTTTGALTVAGGVGITGDIWADGLYLPNDSQSYIHGGRYSAGFPYFYLSASNAGAGNACGFIFQTWTGAATVDAITVSSGGIVAIPGTTASTSTTTGALTVVGGAGIGGAVHAGGLVTASNGQLISVNEAMYYAVVL